MTERTERRRKKREKGESRKNEERGETHVETDVGVSRVELSKLVGVGDLDNLQLLNTPDFKTSIKRESKEIWVVRNRIT